MEKKNKERCFIKEIESPTAFKRKKRKERKRFLKMGEKEDKVSEEIKAEDILLTWRINHVCSPEEVTAHCTVFSNETD